MKKHTAAFSGFFVFLAVMAFAHGDMQHVMGTVTQVSTDSITVKTSKGALIIIVVDPDTQFMKDKASAKITDMKVGVRVVIEVKKNANDPTELVAHTVIIGQMSSMAHHASPN